MGSATVREPGIDGGKQAGAQSRCAPARYTRVAIGLISKIESPLEGLTVPRRRRARRDTEESPSKDQLVGPLRPPDPRCGERSKTRAGGL
jgi:hypothetical protein